jgi:GNAT superfamily N-acetyltransferase
MGPGEFWRNQFRIYRLWILERDLAPGDATASSAGMAGLELRFLDRHARRDWICQRASNSDWPQYRAALQHDHELCVALQDGAEVGWAWIGVERVFLPPLGREIHLPAGTAYLYEAYVRPGARGRGIGRALVGARCQQAARLGFARLLTHVLDGNDASLRALQAHGFRFSGRTRFLRALALRLWMRPPLPVPALPQA